MGGSRVLVRPSKERGAVGTRLKSPFPNIHGDALTVKCSAVKQPQIKALLPDTVPTILSGCVLSVMLHKMSVSGCMLNLSISVSQCVFLHRATYSILYFGDVCHHVLVCMRVFVFVCVCVREGGCLCECMPSLLTYMEYQWQLDDKEKLKM